MQNQYYEQTDEQEVRIGDYLHTINRYKWLVILIFLIVFGYFFITTTRAPRIYKATSKVLVEDKMTSNLLFTNYRNQSSSINNTIHLLSSRPVLRITNQIVQKHNEYNELPISKTGVPVAYVKGRMSVGTERDTDIIIISFESVSPLETQVVSNAIAQAIIQLDTENARAELRNTREFLANQLDEEERRLRAAEEDLRIYKIDHSISSISEETEELIKRASGLEALLSEAEVDLEVAQNNLEYLQSELTSQDTILSDVNSILTTPFLDQLKKEIVEKQTRYVNLLTKSEYSPNHPELTSLNKSIESGKEKLKNEIQRITNLKSGSADPLQYRADLIESILTAKVEKNIFEAKIQSLKEVVEAYDRKLAILPDTEVELARLQRNYSINERIFTILKEKYADAQIAEKSKIGNIRIVEQAQIPSAPIKPNKKRNMIIALVLGVGLGISSALLLHSLDPKITTFDDVRKYVALPILGTIPHIGISDADVDEIEKMIQNDKNADKDKLEFFKQQIEARLITNYAPKSSASESFRILRTNIIANKKPDQPLSVLITSAGPKEGKTTIHSNLAIALAQMGEKTILVDLDLRRPMVHSLFAFDKSNGISDYLIDENSKINGFIKKSRIPNLDIITSGYIPPNPSELLASNRLEKALKYFQDNYDYILFDSPPVIAVTDSMVLASKVDILTLVVRIRRADKLVIKRAKELLENINVKINGAIINGIHPQKYYSSYEYNYYYYYYYGKRDVKKNFLSKIFRKNKSVS